MSVDEHTIELGSTPIFYRSAPAPGPVPLYLHSVPTSSDDWAPFLERTGGIAPDMVGFGRSGKGVELVYSVAGITDYVEALLDALEIEQVQIVAHGWGAAVGLELAQRRPPQVERVVLFNPVPLVEQFSWPRFARLWRIPILGELAMGSTQRWLLARALRHGTVNPAAWTDQRIGSIWEHFDQGTQRATLRLHRSADGDQPSLPDLPGPALVIWGEEDPWFPVAYADAYMRLLPEARLERIGQAGHWPWLDRPELVERVQSFLEDDL